MFIFNTVSSFFLHTLNLPIISHYKLWCIINSSCPFFMVIPMIFYPHDLLHFKFFTLLRSPFSRTCRHCSSHRKTTSTWEAENLDNLHFFYKNDCLVGLFIFVFFPILFYVWYVLNGFYGFAQTLKVINNQWLFRIWRYSYTCTSLVLEASFSSTSIPKNC